MIVEKEALHLSRLQCSMHFHQNRCCSPTEQQQAVTIRGQEYALASSCKGSWCKSAVCAPGACPERSFGSCCKNALKCVCRAEAQDVANILGALYIAMLFLGIINAMNVQPVVYQERTVCQHPALPLGHSTKPGAQSTHFDQAVSPALLMLKHNLQLGVSRFRLNACIKSQAFREQR